MPLLEPPLCSICLDSAASHLSVLRCGHVFHSECILGWLAAKPTCPLCKKPAHKSTLRALFFEFRRVGTASEPIDLGVSSQDSGIGTVSPEELQALKARVVDAENRCGTLTNHLDSANEALEESRKRIESLNAMRTSQVVESRLMRARHSATESRLRAEVERLTSQTQQLEKQNDVITSQLERRAEQENCTSYQHSTIVNKVMGLRSEQRLDWALDHIQYISKLYYGLKEKSQKQKKYLDESHGEDRESHDGVEDEAFGVSQAFDRVEQVRPCARKPKFANLFHRRVERQQENLSSSALPSPKRQLRVGSPFLRADRQNGGDTTSAPAEPSLRRLHPAASVPSSSSATLFRHGSNGIGGSSVAFSSSKRNPLGMKDLIRPRKLSSKSSDIRSLFAAQRRKK